MAGLRAATQSASPTRSARWCPGRSLGPQPARARERDGDVEQHPHIAAEQKKNREARASRASFSRARLYRRGDDANFLMVDIHRDPKQFKTDCIKRSVAVGRASRFADVCTRVDRHMAEMQKAIPVFRQILATSVSTNGAGGKH